MSAFHIFLFQQFSYYFNQSFELQNTLGGLKTEAVFKHVLEACSTRQDTGMSV